MIMENKNNIKFLLPKVSCKRNESLNDAKLRQINIVKKRLVNEWKENHESWDKIDDFNLVYSKNNVSGSEPIKQMTWKLDIEFSKFCNHNKTAFEFREYLEIIFKIEISSLRW